MKYLPLYTGQPKGTEWAVNFAQVEMKLTRKEAEEVIENLKRILGGLAASKRNQNGKQILHVLRLMAGLVVGEWDG